MLKIEADYNNPNPGTLAFALMEIENLKKRVNALERIAIAVERIATALEQKNDGECAANEKLKTVVMQLAGPNTWEKLEKATQV